MPSTLEHTPAFDEALALMESGGLFTFITGRAGTGKSTLLKHFRETTKLVAPVLAPTGVAALNVEGETIHRFFRFAPGINLKDARNKGLGIQKPEIYVNADLLIIDEISMVRADLLDCIDQFLRAVRQNKTPFGGLRIVVIGDLFQLPPVVTTDERAAFSELYHSPYFFASRVMQELMYTGDVTYIELEKVYRQSEPTFIALLNAVRNRTITRDELKILNTRLHDSPPKDAIVLTAVNAEANALNDLRLHLLPGDLQTFQGETIGEFPNRETPAEPELQLKRGARVMCVANDTAGRYVNGSLGWVKDFTLGNDESEPTVTVDLDEGRQVIITPHIWNIYRSAYDQETRTLNQERLGSYSQIPLKLAWAVTIHKSQGKTFDQVTIDLGRGAFASGQTYVALSRCRSFEGLHLSKPVILQDVLVDAEVMTYVAALKNGFPERLVYEGVDGWS